VAFTETLLERAKALKRRVVLPEVEDERTLKAAAHLTKNKIVEVVLVGEPDQVKSAAGAAGADVSQCEIISPTQSKDVEPFAAKLYALRKHKGLTTDQAREQITDHLYFATMLLKEGRVDGYVAGASHTTAENLRPPLQIVKAAPGINTVSSFFLMVHPDSKWGVNGVLLFADCAMVEKPTAEQLADIAISSAKSFKQLVGAEARVALLSYSTKGSAKSSDTEKVLQALELVRKNAPHVAVDGELQADAALISSVAEKKCKGSAVGGKANCLIFPDLDAGNIGYKLVQRLAGAMAIGPMVQGMAKPAHDLSRGCSAEEIVLVSAVAAIMAD
jgi:phosphate acetyltransferase